MIIKNYACLSCYNISDFEEGEDCTKCKYCGSTNLQLNSTEIIDDVTDKVIQRITTGEPTINLPKCPICGSYDVGKVRVIDRAVSVGVFGLASSKIGKTHKCNSCGTTW